MKQATVFKNGTSTQAIRIPKEFRLTTKEVWVEKVGETLIIKPKKESWADFFLKTPLLSDDFSLDRQIKVPQTRKEFLE